MIVVQYPCSKLVASRQADCTIVTDIVARDEGVDADLMYPLFMSSL